MDVLYKIIGVALVSSIAVMVVKPVKSEFAVFISIAGGLVIVFMLATYLSDVFDVFDTIFEVTGINSSLYALIFKIIGVGYLTEFAASICSDTGNSSIGDKVLLGGKIIILVMALPIVTSILDIVIELLPT